MIIDVYKITLNSPTTPNRHHYGLFIQAHGGKAEGFFFHVLGDVQSGYTFDVFGGNDDDEGVIVEEICGFLGKDLVGYAKEDRFGDLLDMCEAVPPPGVQMNEKGVKIDKSTPWIRDGEWVEELIGKLKEKGLLTML